MQSGNAVIKLDQFIKKERRQKNGPQHFLMSL